MPRQIKFRAWDTKTKKWLTAVPSLEYLLDDEDACVSHRDYDVEDAVYFYPNFPLGNDFEGRIIYQQFVGITDGAKEVYEGDILEREYNVSCHKMSDGTILEGCEPGNFSIKRHHFNQVEWNVTGFDLGGINRIGWYKKDGFKVVGNIFENPELLNNES
jgi:hypothetical protein